MRRRGVHEKQYTKKYIIYGQRRLCKQPNEEGKEEGGNIFLCVTVVHGQYVSTTG
jgi:hypothetical protein